MAPVTEGETVPVSRAAPGRTKRAEPHIRFQPVADDLCQVGETLFFPSSHVKPFISQIREKCKIKLTNRRGRPIISSAERMVRRWFTRPAAIGGKGEISGAKGSRGAFASGTQSVQGHPPSGTAGVWSEFYEGVQRAGGHLFHRTDRRLGAGPGGGLHDLAGAQPLCGFSGGVRRGRGGPGQPHAGRGRAGARPRKCRGAPGGVGALWGPAQSAALAALASRFGPDGHPRPDAGTCGALFEGPLL